MTTWQQLRKQITQEISEDDARWILEEVSGYSTTELVTNGSEEITELVASRVEQMINRRIAGEPIQYVLGSWSFRGIDLFVDNRVLIPRPETEVVVEYALETVADLTSPTVLDIGTGSAAIALAVAAEIPTAEVWATDISADALTVARANVAGLGILGRNIHLEEGELFDPLPESLRGEVDLIVSNPPYVPSEEKLPDEVSNFEPHIALFAGPEGLDIYPRLIKGSTEFLRIGGFLVLEIAPDQAKPVSDMAVNAGFDVEVLVDLAGHNRAVRARYAG